MRKIAGRVNTSPDIIDDACAFAWVQFMRRQPSRERPWRAWLITTAEREAWRLHAIEAGHEPFELTREEGGKIAYEPADPRADRAEQHAEALEALSVLATVPERRRRAQELHVSGLTYAEIAQELGLSPTRVNALITEANAAIRKERDRRAGPSVPRSARAARLDELERKPPEWLRSAIGRQRKGDGHHAMLVWRRAALAIDDYRRLHGHHLGDEPMGERPVDAAAARAFDLAQRAAERVHTIRNRGLER